MTFLKQATFKQLNAETFILTSFMFIKMTRKKFRTFVSDMCYIYYGVRQLRKKSLANES